MRPAIVVLSVLGGVLATAAAGILFSALRRHTGGILGPVLAHWLINSLALAAAGLARL